MSFPERFWGMDMRWFGVRLLVLAVLWGGAAEAVENAGEREASERHPFHIEEVAAFDTPWSMVFLDDRRLLVTEKPGRMWIVGTDGRKSTVSGVPEVSYDGQNGLLDVALAPDYARSGVVYVTYVEPDRQGGSLVLAVARLAGSGLADRKTIWRQEPRGGKLQPGGIIAFSPDGRYLFLTVGDRQLPQTAQDLDTNRGKVLRLLPDGASPPDNPMAGQGGVRGPIWTYGHRNAYGLAFAPDGRLWLDEMGPRGGDELNLIEKGKNYGWPLVSNGDNYDGSRIPRHVTRPDLQGPELYWTPVVTPAGLMFYSGRLFTRWKGSAFIGGLKTQSLVRIAFDDEGHPHEADRWDLGARIRDVIEGPDGALWVIEDGRGGRLQRLVP